ncbi:MAG: aminodeoxychorismate/anthranilate synthase component II [Ignavibacteria bacterium]|nr:aminodeoxychorismate/anthranilate synthase component II [Ignavibacteria bacterium]
MTLLIIDNVDSFTWNLAQLARSCGAGEVTVRRNDDVDVETAMRFDGIILSPGPGVPSEAASLCDVIRACAPCKRMLGVCLGHQAIAEVFGATLVRLDTVFHGVTARVRVIDEGEQLFRGLGTPFAAGLYHSWAVSREPFPAALAATALSDDGILMALRHRQYDVRGVQFHPESVMTPAGATIMRNWLDGFGSPAPRIATA